MAVTRFEGHFMVVRLDKKVGQPIQERINPNYLPTKAHKRREKAEKMADRLATKNPGVTYIVIQVVSRAKQGI